MGAFLHDVAIFSFENSINLFSLLYAGNPSFTDPVWPKSYENYVMPS